MNDVALAGESVLLKGSPRQRACYIVDVVLSVQDTAPHEAVLADRRVAAAFSLLAQVRPEQEVAPLHLVVLPLGDEEVPCIFEGDAEALEGGLGPGGGEVDVFEVLAEGGESEVGVRFFFETLGGEIELYALALPGVSDGPSHVKSVLEFLYFRLGALSQAHPDIILIFISPIITQ